MQFEFDVFGEEVEFEPIEADGVNEAIKQIRSILKNPSVWSHGTQPFTASVTVWNVVNKRRQWSFSTDCAARERMYETGCPTCGSRYPSENFHSCPNHSWHMQPALHG